jgi:hypothetical protein
MEVYLHAFLTLAVHGGDWSASRLGHYITGERILDTVRYEVEGHKAGLDMVEGRKISALT